MHILCIHLQLIACLNTSYTTVLSSILVSGGVLCFDMGSFAGSSLGATGDVEPGMCWRTGKKTNGKPEVVLWAPSVLNWFITP